MVKLDNRDVFIEELERAGYTLKHTGDCIGIIEPKARKPQYLWRIEPTGKLNITNIKPSLVAEIDESGNLTAYDLRRKDFVSALHRHTTYEDQSFKDMLGYCLFKRIAK